MESDEHSSNVEIQSKSLDSKATLKRGIFMLIFVGAFWVGEILLSVTAIFQFVALLIAGQPNQFLVRFGRSLSKWIAAITQFLTCASDDMPFPWAEWPSSD